MDDVTDLVKWLREQLDDDERAARAWLPLGNPTAADRRHIARHDPARVLRRVAADRGILDEHCPVDPCDAHDASLRSTPCDTLRLLALPYADRPGYREDWRP